MAWANNFRGPLAALLFLATAITDVAINHTTTPITNIQISLHTADPSSGNQTTSESAYTSYARVAVARSGSGWNNSSGVITNVAAVTFPACTGGSSSLTHVGAGTAASGTGSLWVAGALTAGLSVSTGITPQFAISGLSITVA